MATLSTSGIATGQTIQASQITQIVTALNGGASTDINIQGNLELGSIADVETAIASAGAPGSSGTSGRSGSSGTSGATGSPGSSGTSGATGSPGSSGTSGATGSPGSSGTSGATGSPGSSGTSGTSISDMVYATTAGSTASPTIITGVSTPSLDDINGGILVVYGGANTTSGLRFGFQAQLRTEDFKCTVIFPGATGTSDTSGNTNRRLQFSATPYNAAVTYTRLATGAGDLGGYKFEQSNGAGNSTWTVTDLLMAGGMLEVTYSYDRALLAFHGDPME